MDKHNRQALQALMQDEKFRSVELYFKMLKVKYLNEQVKGDTEFETLWRTAQREAKIELLDSIINGLIEETTKDA